ncbi:hypothetical protein BT96DRAFT_429984 [Gymnopus androsaceus JB14]|uniref:Uncharacterized protein n=1 Tax=Gymnopus androsaceus JB14 TaxID=1447944 RepID=A0A6A4GS53_9AGAR|nr:hypothetical protein BT96DRAFT_429984 [Gymnopus androsaceus JB14]
MIDFDYSYELAPTAILAMDGNYYLVALWNRPHPGHTSEAIIEAARSAFGVDEKAIPEWHRFPLTWVVRDKQEREKRALDERAEDLAIANEPPLSAPGIRAY